MVGRMGGGLYFLVETELKMSKIPPITNFKMLQIEMVFSIHSKKRNLDLGDILRCSNIQTNYLIASK